MAVAVHFQFFLPGLASDKKNLVNSTHAYVIVYKVFAAKRLLLWDYKQNRVCRGRFFSKKPKGCLGMLWGEIYCARGL